MLKAYYCDEYDLYAAESPEQAAQLYIETCGASPDADDGYPRELTDAELDTRHPAFDADERQIEGETTSVREMLVQHGDDPGWLAGIM